MIKSIYPTNILVKQLTITDEELSSIFVYLKAQHLSFLLDESNDLKEYNSGNENIIYDAITKGQCLEMAPLIQEVKDALSFSISNVNDILKSETNYYKLFKLDRAQEQIVNGCIYKLNFTLILTKCVK